MENELMKLLNMSVEELKNKMLSFNLNEKEQEVFDKCKGMLDKLYDMNNANSSQKVALDLIAYMIYKQKGGK